MNITEFTALEAEKLEQFLHGEMQENVSVRAEKVMKLNDQCLHGISILKGDDPAPTFYTEEQFRMFEKGTEIDELVQELADAYLANRDHGPLPAEDLPDMKYKTIKSKAGLRLIGKDYNREYLKTVPYKDVGNGYALICDVQIKASDFGVFSTVVTNSMAEEYGYDMDKLFSAALDNAWKSMSASLRGVGEIMGDCGCRPEAHEQETCFVLTTERQRFGAAALFFPGTQAMIAHVLEEDYIAIPSSLHEFMIVRASIVGDPGHLQQLVREANRTIVGPGEVLSDNILKYSRKTGELTILSQDGDLFCGTEDPEALQDHHVCAGRTEVCAVN